MNSSKIFFIFFYFYPFHCFSVFIRPGSGLAEQHFRVFPSSSDQFKVISARSGSQAVNRGRNEVEEVGGCESQYTMKEKPHKD